MGNGRRIGHKMCLTEKHHGLDLISAVLKDDLIFYLMKLHQGKS